MDDIRSDSGDEAGPMSRLTDIYAIQGQGDYFESTFEFLAWKDIVVTVESRRYVGLRSVTERREILHGISGFISTGVFVAVIGASGCGKTTLLNVLAGRRIPSSGEVLYNGVPLRSVVSLSQRMAYVMQEDVHLQNLTCRETLQYAALLRLRNLNKTEKLKRVEQLLRQFGLTNCADTYVGAGLSGGERKRLSIAMELVLGAELLLLDEPTSGLDSFTAESVVKTLSSLAAAGTTVLTTIHQPSSDMFNMFEQLIVMAGGYIVYQGEASGAIEYFGGFGYQCPQYCNPGDFIMRILRSTTGNGEGEQGIVEDLAVAHARQFVLPPAMTSGVVLFDDFPLSYAAGPFLQFRVLLWRALTNVRRDPYLMYARIAQTVFLGLLAGAIFWQLPNTYHGITSKIGALFFLLFNQAIAPVIGIIHSFPTEKTLLMREQRSGMYRLSLYYLSKILVEWPVQMVFPCLFVAIWYYMVGFNSEAHRFFVLMAILVAMASIGQGLGLLASVTSDNLAVTLAVIPVVLMPFAILSGFLVQTVPSWLVWLERISFYRLAFENAVVNEFHNVTLPQCPVFDPICPRTPDDIFRMFNADPSSHNITKNWIVLVIYSVGLRLVSFIILWLRVKIQSTD